MGLVFHGGLCYYQGMNTHTLYTIFRKDVDTFDSWVATVRTVEDIDDGFFARGGSFSGFFDSDTTGYIQLNPGDVVHYLNDRMRHCCGTIKRINAKSVTLTTGERITV